MTPESNPKPNQPDWMDALAICWLLVASLLLTDYFLGGFQSRVSYLAGELLPMGLAVLYLWSRRLPLRATTRWNRIPSSLWLPLIVVSVSAAVLFDALDRLIGLVIILPPEELERIRKAFTIAPGFSWLWMALGIIVAAPVVEETLFRGVIQQVVESKRDPASAVLVTSALFAVIHLQPYWLIQLLILSFYLGFLAWRWNSIIPAVAVHSANNIWSLLLVNHESQLNGFYLWRGQVNPIIILCAILLFVVGNMRLAKPQNLLVV